MGPVVMGLVKKWLQLYQEKSNVSNDRPEKKLKATGSRVKKAELGPNGLKTRDVV